MLGFVLVAVAIFGLSSGDVPKLWATIIWVVAVLNVLRAIPHPDRQSLGSALDLRPAPVN